MKKFFHTVLTLFLLLIISLLLFVGYISLRYMNWEKEFEKGINTTYVINQTSAESIDLGGKIAEFALSTDDVRSLELNVTEIGSVIYNTLDSYFGENINVERIYIQPSESRWVIYIDLRYKRFSVWVSVDINKDNVQSAQLYITEIKVGPFDISDISDVSSKINKGIGEAMVTLNENGLVGRYIENIELLGDFFANLKRFKDIDIWLTAD